MIRRRASVIGVLTATSHAEHSMSTVAGEEVGSWEKTASRPSSSAVKSMGGVSNRARFP